jgi:hypothetical protein
MQIVPIDKFAQEGMMKDAETVLLPPAAFSDVNNIRIRDGSVGTILGESLFRTVSIAPEAGIHWPRPEGGLSVFVKNNNAVSISATGTVGTLSTTLPTGQPWKIDKFGGGYAVYINNGASTPKYVLVNGGAADTAFVDFPGWNYGGVTVTAKVIKPLGYALVAGNLTITQGSTVTPAPVTVRISVQAPVGGFPNMWEPGLTTDTADEFEINADTPIVDMAELRGSMFIYTYNSIHVLTTSSGNSNVRGYSKSHGALSQNCIAEFDGHHMVADRNDIYAHNGSGEIKSLIDKKNRDYFINNLNPTHSAKTFLIRNSRYNEIWVCYPNLASQGNCNEALIFNYRENTWTKRDLPNLTNIFSSEAIASNSFTPGKEVLIGCNTTTNTFLMDSTWSMWNGTAFANYTSYVTRERIVPNDPSGDFQINSLYPILTVYDSTTIVQAQLVGTDIYDTPVDWSNVSGRDTFTVNPKEVKYGYKFDPRVQGRFLSYKIFSDKPWKLSGMGLGLSIQKNRR